MNTLLHSRLARTSVLATLAILVGSCLNAFAANPTEGTLNPSSTTPLQWVGNALGAPAVTSEAACQDGINCDVFTIHLSGNASDYAGTQLVVKITFMQVSDYD